MQIIKKEYEKIKQCLPVQIGNVLIYNLVLLNAILYIFGNGCKC